VVKTESYSMTEHPNALLLKLITIYVEGFEVSNITVL